MSAPADKKMVDKLSAIADANIEAGDWADDVATLPGQVVPDTPTEAIVKASGKAPAPKK
jgi:hypothetical protein